jgi:hypothetical protein
MYASAFTPYFKDLLRQGSYRNILSDEMFNLNYIDKISQRFLNGQEAHGAELRDLFSLCMLLMAGWYGD